MDVSFIDMVIGSNIFVPPLQDAIDNKIIQPDEGTGKLKIVGSHSNDVPWNFIKTHPDNLCGFWNHILFRMYGNKMGMPAEGCQSCWKIVVRPRTLEELFKLEKIQQRLVLPSKCGIEKRFMVHGLYGGYFYTRSLEEGQSIYKKTRREVDINISSAVDVFLKRGCTEMENFFGDSDKWEVTERSAHWEKLVTDAFDYKPFKPAQPEHFKNAVRKKWIEWAYAHGDSTYKLYTNGKPLYKNYITYHNR